MNFRTTIPIVKSTTQITYDTKITALGSCFAQHMSSKLKNFQFQVIANPFGISFHPLAIERLLQYAVSDYVFSESDVFCHQEIWSCFATHSDMNELSEQECIDKLNDMLAILKQSIQTGDFLLLTFGTAWFYRYNTTGEIVSNCHKLPQNLFTKEVSRLSELMNSYERIFTLVRTLNPDVKIITTISPVRHTKDGFVENQRSKGLLHVALQEVIERDEEIAYFPAYELMMDELRDYRFYEADMIHPNGIAIDYIWEKFKETFIDVAMYPVMKKVDEVQRGLNHRPFNPTATQHLAFLDTLIEKIDSLLDKYPFMNFR